MKKLLKSLTLTASFSLLLVTTWVLSTNSAADDDFGSCTARCNDGSTVTCFGVRCGSTDGVGCVGDGKVTLCRDVAD